MEYTGEIYVVRNKTNNKCYVGQARKHVGKVKLTWGTNGRWKSHIREAFNTVEKGQKDHCVLLNQAIRKYGVDNFEVTKLEDVTDDNIDEREAHYIKEHNSVVPFGYNLNHGGAKGKDSDATREKKRLMRLNQQHSDEVKAKISKGQLGNRRGPMKRKYPEDESLPKYITSVRIGGVITGYCVNSFPIGKETKEYIKKSFVNKKNPEEAYKQAIDLLDKLQLEYGELTQQKEEPVVVDAKKSIKNLERAARVNKKGMDKYDMPKYVSLITVKDKEVGFMVDGLRIIKEDETVKRYTKTFTDPKLSMEQKLAIAIQHLEEMKSSHNCLLDKHTQTTSSKS